jgi:hypothetical protein
VIDPKIGSLKQGIEHEHYIISERIRIQEERLSKTKSMVAKESK